MNKIAAKDSKGNPCCNFLGSGGAGHYIKMVHNGIEYAEMQLLAEVFEILMTYFKLDFRLVQKELESWKIVLAIVIFLELHLQFFHTMTQMGLALLVIF